MREYPNHLLVKKSSDRILTESSDIDPLGSDGEYANKDETTDDDEDRCRQLNKSLSSHLQK